MKISRIFLLALILAAASFVQAQPSFETTVNFSMGFPQGDFADNVDSTGFGMTTEFNYRISHGPVLIGGSFGFLQYGSEERVVPFSPGIPDVLVEVDTSNNIFLSHFLVRYEFGGFEPRVKPYVEGLVGLQYLWTQTGINDDYDDDFTTTNFDDTAPSFGVGGGVLVGLVRGPTGLFRMDLNLGARYMFGGEAEYLAEGDVLRGDDVVYYRISESSTNLIMANIGLVFSF